MVRHIFIDKNECRKTGQLEVKMKKSPRLLASLCVLILLLIIYMYLRSSLSLHIPKGATGGSGMVGVDEGMTIRVNTFKRLDLLKLFWTTIWEPTRMGVRRGVQPGEADPGSLV